jgi:hypothetical protein
MKLGELRKALRRLAIEYGDNVDVAFDDHQIFMWNSNVEPQHPNKPSLREAGWIIDGGCWTLLDKDK